MRFITVAERELSAASRRKVTYRGRWVIAAAFFGLMAWLAWVFDIFANRGAGTILFRVFSVCLLVYCLFVGAAGTADCLSREKRDGTLGLLYLTNLNSAEIVGGKLCSNGLALIYLLVAIFPVLALPVLIGGVTFANFWCSVLALVNGLFFAIAAGFLASALCVRQFPAVALATGLSLFFGLALLGISEIVRNFGGPSVVSNALAAFCPLHALLRAQDFRLTRGWLGYWPSLVAVAALSWSWLAWVAWWMGRTWRDRPKKARRWNKFVFTERLRERGKAGRTAFRRRLLDINPFFWLAGRGRVSAPVFMVLTVVLVLITVFVTTQFFGQLIRGGPGTPMVGHLFAWVWTGFAIHSLVLYYGAMVASQRLAEDKQTGALELILSTPASERLISRGLWMGYWRRMFFPVLLAVLVHGFFVWQLLNITLLNPSGGRPPLNVTAGQLFWAALLNQPIGGFAPPWEFGFPLRILVLLLVVLAASWIMLGWLGRWLGLWMKHPGFAPMISVGLTVGVPMLLFGGVCFVADRVGVTRLPEQRWLPIMMWIAFGITIANCLVLSTWAAGRLRRDFRATVTGRYEPTARKVTWRVGWRMLLRAATAAAALLLVLALMILGFYSYQNWSGQRRWTAFQTQLQQRGESLDVAALLPAAVPIEQNFVRAPAFQHLLDRKTPATATAILFQKSAREAEIPSVSGPASHPLNSWMKQTSVPLDPQAAWIVPNFNTGVTNERKKSASLVCEGLEPLRADLEAVAAAQLPFFQAATNRNTEAVLHSNLRELCALEQLHFLFALRACAGLALDRPREAGEDVLTSLRLAQLVRQSPDAKSSVRVQMLLARSLQPLWEGLAEHHWNEAQLAAFQQRLSEFNLLADHTNAVHRVVLAHVEMWRSIPDTKAATAGVAAGGGNNRLEREWDLQPRAWWLDNAIQLYRAGQNALARVDVDAERMEPDGNWSNIGGLPLLGDAMQLFQQVSWWGPSPSLVSFAQTAVNQAVIACALERHHLAHGDYPESLNQLVPGYTARLPRDVSRGTPMFYQRTDDGSYILRGAGPDGLVSPDKATYDDWVWAFTSPTNSPPATGKKP